MADYISDIEGLEALYGTPSAPALIKVTDYLTPAYRAWVEAARFCILSTVGPEGTDASPRGDDGPVLHVLDDRHLALPDWRGNNRLDSLRNIVRDGRVSLMVMVPGHDSVVRVNGTARVTADEALRASFARGDKLPITVTVVEIAEVYVQCARAILRAGLWQGGKAPDLPSIGAIVAEIKAEIDAEALDTHLRESTNKTLW